MLYYGGNVRDFSGHNGCIREKRGLPMKTKFWIVLLVLLLAVSAAASFLLLKPGKIADGAEI